MRSCNEGGFESWKRWAGKVQGTPELLWLIWMFELRGTEGGGRRRGEGSQRGKFSVLLDIWSALCLGRNPLLSTVSSFCKFTCRTLVSNFSFQIFFFFFFGRRTNSMINKKESKAKLSIRIPFVWLICADTNFIWDIRKRCWHHQNLCSVIIFS